MKKTRRAAAVWMTMSLALSTIFGNTAWGEVLQETGKNRCAHVHTAECYGDLDETATPSQIGELEPTECTHVCSVESGCILDTEDKKNEDVSNEDQEPSGGKASDNEILDDQEVPSVNTPSNAKDNTSTINGTTMSSSKTKVHSWTWYDPEGILIDGKLELTGVTEEAQPSFAEVTEYLPQAIIAQVGDSEAWEEETLQIVNWTCPEYVQDENGLWPLEGNYEFTAELPEGYELADGVDALVVEVSVAGDQLALTDGYTVMNINFEEGKDPKDLNLNGNELWSYNNNVQNMGKANGMSFFYEGNDNFRMTLSNTSICNIIIKSGNWTIELYGNNTLDGKGKSASGTGLWVQGGSARIIAGEASAALNVESVITTGDALDASCAIRADGSLTIDGGNITATSTGGKKNHDLSGAIYVQRGGSLNINGGSITASGEVKHGLATYGTFNMSGGTLKIIGQYGNVVENGGNFTLSDGRLTVESKTSGYGFYVRDGGTVTITGEGELDTCRLRVNNGFVTVEKGGTIKSETTIIDENGKLENKGNFVSNGGFENNGTFGNTGTISGTGSVPEEARQTPDRITGYQSEITTTYSESEIDIGNKASVVKPEKAGSLKYSLVEYTGAGVEGEGTITEDGKLTVNKAGIFIIKVTTAGTGIYKAGDDSENDQSVYIKLTVTQSPENKDWSLSVNAVNKEYDGNAVEAATITAAIPSGVNARYKYQLSASNNKDSLDENEWESSCPKVTNVSDSDQYVFVKVETDNYESKVFCSTNRTKITPANLKDVRISLDKDTFTYNSGTQVPFVTATNVAGNELTKDKDYTISYTDGKNAVQDPIDAGSYTVKLTADQNENYRGTAEASFTIEKCKLKPEIGIHPLVKTYDGTTNIAAEQILSIYLYDASSGTTPEYQEVYVNEVEWAYRGKDVGEQYIDATIISLAGDKLNNYELVQKRVSLKSRIVPRDFESMVVSATPLTYNGNEQQPQIDASVDTGINTASGSNAKFYYSMDGEKFKSEVPNFKDPGTYTVHVKAEMDNFNPIMDKVEVIVQKAAAPTVAGLSETYSYKETGEKRVKFTGIPEDCGTLGAVTAQIVSDESKILDGSPAIDGSEVVFKLKGSSKEMIGKTAQIVVTVEMQNYENIEIPVTVTLKADPSDNDSENGNSGNNNSGNNSGNGNSGNNNSGNGNSGSGSNGGNSGSSGSGSSSDDSDYNDSKTTAPKLSDVRSGNAANNAANNVTKDSKKGYQSSSQGVITGADNQVTNDGYSHWMKDSKGWWLRYSDGSYPKGSAGEYHWEKINGRWWAFGPDGYLSTGWIYDTLYQGWFYMDANKGMLTGWQFIDGKWYYLNPVSDGTCGIMYAKKRTPDGWLVKEDGSWDEEAGK